MADTNETIADIIAEMRYKAGAICPWQVNGGTCELCPLGHSPHGKDLGKYCSFHKLAHELEAAHRREREAITPKSDPDWKDICAKCKDGDIEPNYCKYYGEPNGCNSPIYGSSYPAVRRKARRRADIIHSCV